MVRDSRVCGRHGVSCHSATAEVMSPCTLIAVFACCLLTPTTPFRVIIDCQPGVNVKSTLGEKNVDVLYSIKEFCRAVHKIMPRPKGDGIHFLTEEVPDQQSAGNDEVLISTLPPKSLIIKKLRLDNDALPRSRMSKVKVPKIKVPKLQHIMIRSQELRPPSVVDVRPYEKVVRGIPESEESSAERLENFKRGLKKMLHVVKVLGKIDKYLSDRIRIVIDRISKIISE